MTLPEQITILGAGGHAKVVIDTLRLIYDTAVISVYDDAKHKQGSSLLSISVETPIPTDLDSIENIHIAIGNNRIRQGLGVRLMSASNRFIGIIHPKAVVSPYAELNKGHFIAAGAIIAPNAKLGHGVIINHQAVVDHDCDIGSWVHIAPGTILGGGVNIGGGSFIGAGAVILPGIKIGTNVTVGAGAVVTKDVADNNTVVGVPAKLRGKSE